MGRTILRALSIALVFALGACNGGSYYGATSGGPGTGGGSTPGGTTPTPVVRLGSFSGSTFNAGVIAVSTSTLAAGASTTLTVSLVDTANSNAPVTGSNTVSFTSSCLSQGASTINVNPQDISTGTATVTYTYNGSSCGATDTITATVVAGGQALTAAGSVTVTPSPATTIQFVSATPTNIGLQGSGQASTSQIVFAVRNAAGGPVSGQAVSFTLSTTAGGITMTASTANTGADGTVSTIVQAGTVPTSVSVTAALVDNPNTTANEALVPPARSSSLVISTGLADEDSFSLSIGCFNIEGGNYDGVTTSVNVIASDRFNNPVPDGTPISFRSEGGTVQPSCFTKGGQCSVTFTSSAPRLADHRSTIMAYAVGEESFVDANGNGKYDSGESFVDLGDAYLDADESDISLGKIPGQTGTAPTSGDILVDFNGNGSYDVASGNFTGPLCASGCDTQTSLYVRQDAVIIMSGSDANVTFSPSAYIDNNANGTFDPATDTIDLSNGAVSVVVAVSDSANQPMPGGTAIAGSIGNSVGSFSGDSSFQQLCTENNGPSYFTFVIAPPGTHADKSGTFTVKVTTPKGTVTSATVAVADSTSPTPPPPKPAPIGSIKFVSANPTTIGLKGSGQNETSTVTFQVLSTLGGAVANQTVDFTLSTTAGGITLNPASGATDASGYVSTIVQSGTVHTTVKVTASTIDTTVTPNATFTAQSDSLTVSSGIADQNSFTFYAGAGSCRNIEDIDGATVPLQVLAGDAFNNPVPNGSAVAFTTEGGRVDSSCQTSNGACSAIFTDQNPKPANGRVTVLAYMLGEESFLDLNGNGQFDDAEMSSVTDLPEAFRDDNENGVRDTNEPFIDLNGNGSYDGADGLYTGTLCSPTATLCSATKQVTVRGDLLITLSPSSGMAGGPTVDPNTDISMSSTSGTGWNAATLTFDDRAGDVPVLNFIVRDANDNPVPSGTTISVDVVDNKSGGAMSAAKTVPCIGDTSDASNTYKFTFVPPATLSTAATDVYDLTIKTPNGTAQTLRFKITTNP